MPTCSQSHWLFLRQEVGIHACCIGPIYRLALHQTKATSLGTGPSIDRLAPGGDLKSGISKIQQQDFLASHLDFRMDW